MLLKLFSPRCDRCGRSHPDIQQFADVYRQYEAKHGRRPPGNLCGECAGRDTAERLYQEAKAKARPSDPKAARQYDREVAKLERKRRNALH